MDNRVTLIFNIKVLGMKKINNFTAFLNQNESYIIHF